VAVLEEIARVAGHKQTSTTELVSSENSVSAGLLLLLFRGLLLWIVVPLAALSWVFAASGCIVERSNSGSSWAGQT
jgi:hypothetical protein